MFDNIQAYAGNIIGESNSEHPSLNQEMVSTDPQTPEEIMDFAKREAEEIIQAAREEAIAEREAILSNARENAEKKISEEVTSAVVKLRMELFSARTAMGEILSDALDGIVGQSGHDQMMLNAVEKAIADYGNSHKITIYSNAKTLERLRLVAIGAKRNLKEFGLTFQLDAGLADGRCVLSRGEARVEVGLDAQLDALKKVFHVDSQRAQKSAQTQLATFGKLM